MQHGAKVAITFFCAFPYHYPHGSLSLSLSLLAAVSRVLRILRSKIDISKQGEMLVCRKTWKKWSSLPSFNIWVEQSRFFYRFFLYKKESRNIGDREAILYEQVSKYRLVISVYMFQKIIKHISFLPSSLELWNFIAWSRKHCNWNARIKSSLAVFMKFSILKVSTFTNLNNILSMLQFQ